MRPIPAPKPQAIFKANAFSKPNCSLYVDNTAGAQRNPFSNCFFASSALLNSLSPNNMNVIGFCPYHIFKGFTSTASLSMDCHTQICSGTTLTTVTSINKGNRIISNILVTMLFTSSLTFHLCSPRYLLTRVLLSCPQQPALSSVFACAVFSSQVPPEGHRQLCPAVFHRGGVNQN